MSRRFSKAFIVVLLLHLSGCQNPEDEARKLYNHSLESKREGRIIEYESALRTIAATYPQTAVATDANLALAEIAKNHQQVRELYARSIALIFLAQDAYSKKLDHYAKSVEELLDAGIVEEGAIRPIISDTDERWTVVIQPEDDSYIVIATPNHPDQFHFFAKPGLGIRYEEGKAASKNSPSFTLKF